MSLQGDTGRRLIVFAVFVWLCAGQHSALAATVTDVFGGKVSCSVSGGVQFCQGNQFARVESWDGVPLDVNVTIPPAAQDGPFPLIVSLHGWGIGKDQGAATAQASAGYVVVSYSARGFHNSCGFVTARLPDLTLSNPTACNDRGWIRLADARYEVRDTQYLAGLLVDEGLVIPNKIGATGSSYGGGQSMMLAALRNRVMLENGSLVAWTSPLGTPMELAAAAPLIPWSDLGAALAPNGRTLDDRDFNPYGTRSGVLKQSWVDALYTLGLATGFFSSPGADPNADLTGWRTRLNQGEPYDGDALVEHIIDQVTTFHSAYYIDDSVAPAPIYMYNAFTDDLFPAHEALRYYNKTKALHPAAEVFLHFSDGFGHMRAGLTADNSVVDARVVEHFGRYLLGSGDPAPPGVETFTQECGGSTKAGPFASDDWLGQAASVLTFADAAAHSFTSAAGNAANALVTDPVGGVAQGSCRTTAAIDDTNAATYPLPAAENAGFTLVGSPQVTAVLTIGGTDPDFAQVVARLWDVAPDLTQALVAQTIYRPDVSAVPQTFQLHPNGWHFADGHVAKLELLGQSTPYARASNGAFDVTVTGLQLSLPIAEIAGGGGPAVCAAAPVAGCTVPDAPRGSRLKLSDGDADQDKLVWKWGRGPALESAQLGDPANTTRYSFCLYDGGGALLMNNEAPASGTCGRKPCWRSNATGFKYTDKDQTPDGIRKLGLRAGSAGKAKLALVGKSAKIGAPALPITSFPVTAQLVASNGQCWQADYSNPDRNSANQLRARSD